MFGHRMFWIYGATLIGLAGTAEYRGWTVSSINEVRGVPKSIRDNPGSYRSIYTGYSRYSGGK